MVGLNELDKTVELTAGEEHGNTVIIVASVDHDGDLIVMCHELDAGENDHWIAVGAEDKDEVLLRLLRERFIDVTQPCSEFMDWLQAREIRHEVASRAGEHRGSARTTSPGRRNGARGARPTRAGP